MTIQGTIPACADLEALALIATRQAVRRGYTTAELAGCTRLAAAQKLGWVRKRRKRSPENCPAYVATLEGRQAIEDAGL